jgi:elongation factor Ts
LQVQDVLAQAGKELGSELRLTDFLRVQVGEGLEQEQKDFAAEVAETLKAAAA